MTSVTFLIDSVSLDLAKGRVFRGHLAVTIAILHAAVLCFFTPCNSEDVFESSSSSGPERALQPRGCQIFRGEGKEEGNLSCVKTLPVYTNNDNSLQQRQRLMT